MLRVIALAVVFAAFGSVSMAQTSVEPAAPVDGAAVDPALALAPVDPAAVDVAAVDPNAPLPTDASVVGQCTTMSKDVNIADPTTGICITSAQAYIAALVAAPAPLAAPVDGAASPRDAALNALVGQIAQLTQDNICDKRDEELAAAVDAASAAAEATDTRDTLAEIARTIREVCADGTTAAIDDGSPADAVL